MKIYGIRDEIYLTNKVIIPSPSTIVSCNVSLKNTLGPVGSGIFEIDTNCNANVSSSSLMLSSLKVKNIGGGGRTIALDTNWLKLVV